MTQVSAPECRETSNDMVLAGIPVAKGTKFEVMGGAGLCISPLATPYLCGVLWRVLCALLTTAAPCCPGATHDAQVSLRCAMRDPEAWKDPLLFQPARFLPGMLQECCNVCTRYA